MEDDRDRSLFRPESRKERPDISPQIRRLMPDYSEEEQRQATANVRGYVEVLYRIFLRIQKEKEEKKRKEQGNTEIQ